jgi:hypothetical protein
MFCEKKYFQLVTAVAIFLLSLIAVRLFADDDKKATLQLAFSQADSVKHCKAIVTSEGQPQKDKEVHFYVKRLYSLLPVGKTATTDEKGEAEIEFPANLPGDASGNLTVIAKIEDDDTFGTVETKADVKWGTLPGSADDIWQHRSLSASREKAPMYLIIASNTIIAVIWGTIFYVLIQLFRIRKEGKRETQKTTQSKK